MHDVASDEVAIRALIERWAKAVRERDYEGILADHSRDFWMFDVPPPFQSRGIDAYRKTWDLFFSAQPVPAVFDIVELHVTAGQDVAFAVARMHCVTPEAGKFVDLDFRLTIGLRKIDGRWTAMHEHHSVPATD